MIFKLSGNGHGTLCIFLCDDGEITDLISVIRLQVAKRVSEVSGHLSRGNGSSHGGRNEMSAERFFVSSGAKRRLPQKLHAIVQGKLTREEAGQRETGQDSKVRTADSVKLWKRVEGSSLVQSNSTIVCSRLFLAYQCRFALLYLSSVAADSPQG